jgi:hypothetical protein
MGSRRLAGLIRGSLLELTQRHRRKLSKVEMAVSGEHGYLFVGALMQLQCLEIYFILTLADPLLHIVSCARYQERHHGSL